MQASTVHAVMVRCRINRLSHIDRVTGEPLRRYEHPHPGSLIHVDVTKFGNIPDGGGWRALPRGAAGLAPDRPHLRPVTELYYRGLQDPPPGHDGRNAGSGR